MKYFVELMFGLCFSVSTNAENLLPNANFEHGLAGYMLGDAGVVNRVPYNIDATPSGMALTFTAKPADRVALYLPEVKYLPNTEYRLSFMAKSSTDNLPLIISEYVRVGASVGSAGKFFPKLTREWQRYTFTFKTGNTSSWGGFRLIKNNHVNQISADISFADIYLGPAAETTAAIPLITGSLDWDPLDRRVDPGEKMTFKARVVNPEKTAKTVKITWQLRSGYYPDAIASQTFDLKAKPGVNEFPLEIVPRRNGIFRLEATVDGRNFINPIKLAVVPKIRVKAGELPINLGINSVLSNASTTTVTDSELEFLADSGISFIRPWDNGNPFIWREIEPEEQHYNWQATDRLVEATNRAGLEILPVLGGMCFTYPDQQPYGSKPPQGHALSLWLYRKAQIVSCPPNMPQFTQLGRKTALPPLADWERMVTEVAKRYRGKIHYFEVMNEPNLCLTAEQYLPYLQAAWRILKQTDPTNTVIGICATGDYDGHIINYVDEALKLGAGAYFDDLSFHPYNNLYEDSPKSGEVVIKSFYRFLNENKMNRVKLWNTELYFLNPTCRGGSDQVNGPIYHPGYLIRRYLLDASQRIKASILIMGSHMGGVSLINDNMQSNSPSCFFSNRLIPSDKYIVTAIFAQLLRGCRFTETQNLPGKIRAYCFGGNETAVAAVFALQSQTDSTLRKLWFSSLPPEIKILDIFGNPARIYADNNNFAVEVSPIPFYIVAPDTTTLNKVLQTGQEKQ